MSRTVVLVEPENPLNIGFVARAMKCSGISDLRIVSPEVSEMEDSAFRTGTSAKEILESARFFDSLESALEDTHYSVGFSRRAFSETAGFCNLNELPELIPAGVTAFVFGRESQGLFRDELAVCSILCTIPVEGTMSYNLGQAVAVALYETEIRSESQALSTEEIDAPTEGERQALLKRLSKNESFLEKNDRQVQLRKIVSKINLNSQEISLLLGALKQ